jgi:hypothetical protein
MAIKDAAEMFGDGSAGNPQVPIDLNAPPGFNALSRGTAFGEQVTSAIKNRTPYSLVLNDEDLNTRLALFETTGLDAAYDLGTAAVPGGGRVITKDGGAVETQSALASQYADDTANTHYRANMEGDSVRGGVGFDATGLDLAAGANPWAGFMERQLVDTFVTSNTDIQDGDAIQLNPGGADADAIRVTTALRMFHTSGVTELALGVDMIEVVGSVSDDGLYVIDALAAADTDVAVKDLSGAAASFTASDTGTLHLWRPIFRTNALEGSAYYSMKSGAPALALYPNLHEPAGSEGGGFGLVSYYRGADGDPDASTVIDHTGLIQQLLNSAQIRTTSGPYSMNDRFGLFTSRYLVPPSNEVEATHSVLGPYALQPDARFDFSSLHPISDGSTTLTFVAATATDGEVQGTTSNIEQKVAHGGGLVFITGFGWYWVIRGNRAGTLRVDVRELDGSLPTSLPTTGTASAFFYTFQSLGRLPQIPAVYDDPVLRTGLGAVTTVTPYATLVAGGEEADACALMLASPDTNFNQCLIRGFTRGAFGTLLGRPEEVFRVNSQGEVCSRGTVYASDFIVNDPVSRTKTIPLSTGLTEHFVANSWSFGATRWESIVDLDGSLTFLFRLPDGATLTEIKIHISAGNNDTARFKWTLDHVETQFDTASLNINTNQFSLQEAPAAGIQTLTENSFSAPVFDGETDYFMVRCRSGDDSVAHLNDFVYGMRVVFTDPGPRNF